MKNTYTIGTIVCMHENVKKIKTWRKRIFDDHCIENAQKVNVIPSYCDSSGLILCTSGSRIDEDLQKKIYKNNLEIRNQIFFIASYSMHRKNKKSKRTMDFKSINYSLSEKKLNFH